MPMSKAVAEAGILRPEEVALLSQVYNEITSEIWFNHDDEHREAFARYIVRVYERGKMQAEPLKALCLEAARARHSLIQQEDDS